MSKRRLVRRAVGQTSSELPKCSRGLAVDGGNHMTPFGCGCIGYTVHAVFSEDRFTSFYSAASEFIEKLEAGAPIGECFLIAEAKDPGFKDLVVKFLPFGSVPVDDGCLDEVCSG